MQLSFLKINEIEIPVKYNFSAKARRASIRVTSRYAQITLPFRTSPEKYSDFIGRSHGWIYRKFKSLNGGRILFDPLSGDKNMIPFKGADVSVSCKFLDSTYYTRTELAGGSISISMPLHYKEMPGPELRTHIALALRDWLIDRSAEFAQELSARWKHMACKDFRITMKELHTSWGTCSPSNGKISMNWRLIFAPESVHEYVFVHELCHLKYHGHNSSFWQMLGTHIPDYGMKRKWLNKNGPAIGELLNDD